MWRGIKSNYNFTRPNNESVNSAANFKRQKISAFYHRSKCQTFIKTRSLSNATKNTALKVETTNNAFNKTRAKIRSDCTRVLRSILNAHKNRLDDVENAPKIRRKIVGSKSERRIFRGDVSNLTRVQKSRSKLTNYLMSRFINFVSRRYDATYRPYNLNVNKHCAVLDSIFYNYLLVFLNNRVDNHSVRDYGQSSGSNKEFASFLSQKNRPGENGTLKNSPKSYGDLLNSLLPQLLSDEYDVRIYDKKFTDRKSRNAGSISANNDNEGAKNKPREKRTKRDAPPTPRSPAYALVAQRLFRPTDINRHDFYFSPRDAVTLEPGDVVGFYFPDSNPITWTEVPCAFPRQLPLVRRRWSVGNLTVGRQVEFEWLLEDGEAVCRQYSLAALLANNSRSKLTEDWICPSNGPGVEFLRSRVPPKTNKGIPIDKPTDSHYPAGRRSWTKSVNDISPSHHQQLLHRIFFITMATLLIVLIAVALASYCYAIRT